MFSSSLLLCFLNLAMTLNLATVLKLNMCEIWTGCYTCPQSSFSCFLVAERQQVYSGMADNREATRPSWPHSPQVIASAQNC